MKKNQTTLFKLHYCESEATFDGIDCCYRYTLRRVWDPNLKRVCFVMCNPSTADESILDPTVTRCIGFAKRWGFGGLDVVNLFALRSTDPKPLKTHPDPVGRYNDKHILETVLAAGRVVCAWGDVGAWHGQRAQDVIELLQENGVELWALGFSKKANPVHPLYIPGDRELVRLI